MGLIFEEEGLYERISKEGQYSDDDLLSTAKNDKADISGRDKVIMRWR